LPPPDDRAAIAELFSGPIYRKFHIINGMQACAGVMSFSLTGRRGARALDPKPYG
jgi:hypothetical protein